MLTIHRNAVTLQNSVNIKLPLVYIIIKTDWVLFQIISGQLSVLTNDYEDPVHTDPQCPACTEEEEG